MRVEKASKIGLCFGIRRAIDILERVAQERGGVETLGVAVHNRQVLHRLAENGLRIAKSVDDIQDDVVVISAHGVSPQLEEEIRARHVDIIDATCPIVHRAQLATRDLANSDFLVVIYGDIDHPEVKGILGWANGRGLVTVDERFMIGVDHLPPHIGVLSQTTQIPARFTEFVKKLIDSAFAGGSELRVIDTICQDIRNRQASALELAKRVDLMLVIGGRNSANTSRLVEVCSMATKTHLIEAAEEIQPSWLQGKCCIGITGGASTTEQTINEVAKRLEALA